MSKNIFLIVIGLLTVTACGIKGPPLPPISEETVQKQMAGEAASSDTTKVTRPIQK